MMDTNRSRKGRIPVLRDESGMTLLITLLAMIIVALISMVLARVAQSEMELTGNYRGANQAFYAADGGAEYGFDELLDLGRRRGQFPTNGEAAAIPAPALAGYDYTTFDVARDGAMTQGPLTTGFYQGLVAFTQPYTVRSTAETTRAPVGVATVEMTADFDIIPIFQFAIFYEEDLEILPGPDMWLNGRVHSNEDIYIGTHGTLTVDSNVTAAGDIFNERKNDNTPMNGTVQIRDADGNFQAMAGLDSNDPDWVEDALERWDGNVRSGEHDVDRLNLTIEDPLQPRRIIEPMDAADDAGDEAAKIWYEAETRIVNGVAYDQDGNVLDSVDPVTGENAIAQTVLWDAREEKHMLTTQVDMEKFGRSPAWPANGIVYAGGFEPDAVMPNWPGGNPGVGPAEFVGYDTPWSGTGTTAFGVKLTNGQTLQDAVTVVSDNPSYVHGDYNINNKVGAAVIADAVTILSNRWGDVDGDGDFDDDLTYSELDLSDRNAWDTTVNAALMMGNTDSVPGVEYNGGVENVLRFLERWSGDTLTYRGSIIDLWNSVTGTGEWIYGDPIYTAPNRDWAFDTDFLDPANLPPGTPNVYTIRVIGWNRF